MNFNVLFEMQKKKIYKEIPALPYLQDVFSAFY